MAIQCGPRLPGMQGMMVIGAESVGMQDHAAAARLWLDLQVCAVQLILNPDLHVSRHPSIVRQSPRGVCESTDTDMQYRQGTKVCLAPHSVLTGTMATAGRGVIGLGTGLQNAGPCCVEHCRMAVCIMLAKDEIIVGMSCQFKPMGTVRSRYIWCL